MRPVIGITCAWDQEKGRVFLRREYLEAVQAAGGIPLPLAYTSDRLSLDRITTIIDGLLLSGGSDVDPVHFGQEPIPECGEICPERDGFEIDLARAAAGLGIPVLGICRGIQVMNIAAGGDIYQDLASQAQGPVLKHSQEAPRWHCTHAITVQPGTVLATILGPGTIRVNSLHHQAVMNVAPGFMVSARSNDGVVEAVEFAGPHFSLGLQCHPEDLWQRQPVFLKAFERLVTESRIRMQHL